MIQNPESSAEADPLIGRTIAHYTIQSKLGWDAAGVIYQARDNEAAKEILFKTFHAHIAADAGRMQRFEHDAMAVSALSTPTSRACMRSPRWRASTSWRWSCRRANRCAP